MMNVLWYLWRIFRDFLIIILLLIFHNKLRIGLSCDMDNINYILLTFNAINFKIGELIAFLEKFSWNGAST